MNFLVIKTTIHDLGWITDVFRKRWFGVSIVSRGHIHTVDTVSGLKALRGDEAVGLLTYAISGQSLEIVTLDSFWEHHGIGTTLIEAIIQEAKHRNLQRIWAITTNDNLEAIEFYKRRGFMVAAVHKHAVDALRKIKPAIPRVGLHGIPIEDEIEVEFILSE